MNERILNFNNLSYNTRNIEFVFLTKDSLSKDLNHTNSGSAKIQETWTKKKQYKSLFYAEIEPATRSAWRAIRTI